MKITCKFYLPELLVFDSWVTKISVKPVKNSPVSKKKKRVSTIFRTTWK